MSQTGNNMKSSFAFFILFSLLWFANVINARKDAGEYWRAVMKDQPMPEAIQGLIRTDPTTLPSVSNEKADCHTIEFNKKKNFVKDIGPVPTATVYDNGIKPNKDEFSEDFDPRPNVSVYDDGVGLKEKKMDWGDLNRGRVYFYLSN